MKNITDLTNMNNNGHSFEADLQRLISLVRERQSSLVVLLQQKKQKTWERPEWLMKECQYQQKSNRLSRQIRSIILQWVLLSDSQEPPEQSLKCIHQFWVKIKIVMKMSLERIKMLNLLNYPLFQKYQAIIEATNIGYDRAAGIGHFRDIEEMIKRRNVNIHYILGNFKVADVERQRSEPSVKRIVIRQFASELKLKKNLAISKREKDHATIIGTKIIRRPLSQQNNKVKMRSKQLLKIQKIKKIKTMIEKYENNIADVMDGKLDINIDVKKNVAQNMEELFDQIMEKNISNRRIISKFAFSHSGHAFKRLQFKRALRPITQKILGGNHTPKLIRKQDKKKQKLAYTCSQIKCLKTKKGQFGIKARRSHIFETEFKLYKLKKIV